MKKTIVAAVVGVMGFATSAMAIDAAHTFTWSGTVPAAPVSNGWHIKTPTGQDLNSGILTFRVGASGGELTGSTELAFAVFEDDGAGAPDLAKQAGSYDIELTSLAVNSSGLAAEQTANGYFAIHANGVLIEKNTAVVASSGTTLLRVASSGVATPSNQPDAGDSVDVHATIVVTNSAV